MNFFKKYKILPWLLAFIGIVLISAATSWFVSNSGILNKEKNLQVGQPGRVLQSELSLTPAQSIKVEQINTSYRASTESIISSIRDKKTELLDELSKDQTDTNQLSEIADELCTEQKKLQKANIDQFLELKKVCNTEQTKKLSQIYAELYGCQSQGSGKGQGQGMGMGHRYRWGQQRQNRK